MALNITITDPNVIALLQDYRHFVSQVDEADGSLDELAEGLVCGLLDEHPRFRAWHREVSRPASTV